MKVRKMFLSSNLNSGKSESWINRFSHNTKSKEKRVGSLKADEIKIQLKNST